jgi:hypothetical protein
MSDNLSNDWDWEEFFHQFPCGAAVIFGTHVVHAVGYPEPVSDIDETELRKELAEDHELELTLLRDYSVIRLEGDNWRQLMQQYAGADGTQK